MVIKYTLKKIRQEKQLTQTDLAKRSGVSKSMISAIETGERHPTLPILLSLAKALRVQLTQLYSERRNF